MAYIAPIIAAANKKKQDEEEESLMAEFMKNDKSGEWEYKIIRGTLGEFRSEARMQRALEAESRASWELAMKLDDERLVLRRHRSARSQDANLDPGVRPYRTDYGGKTILLIVGMLLLILGVIAFALFSGGSGLIGLGVGEYSIIMIGILVIMVVIGIVVVAMKFRR